MKHDSIESAFATFLTELRQADFAAPEEGWGAELVAAHLTRTNDLIAEAAEEIAAGRHPVYDNAPAVDEASLREYVAEVGGICGLAAALEAPARRLAAARRALEGTSES